MTAVPLVSFQVNSYNCLARLRNLLKSFELCNEYPNVEWIITDYGSGDGSRDFIRDYARSSGFPVKAIFSDEEEYFERFRQKGLFIDSRWAKFRAILGKYRSEARRAAAGELLYDMSDDHQFIRKGNWVEEILDIYRHREATVGRDDIAGIVAYGYMKVRLGKLNNVLLPITNEEATPYFVAREKSYVDYVFMKRSTAAAVGEYFDPLTLRPGTAEGKRWAAQDDFMQPEAEYERRCRRLGLKRVFMKYPMAVAFPNNIESVSCPIWSLEEMKRQFGYLNRPVSSDELCRRRGSDVLWRVREGLLRLAGIN